MAAIEPTAIRARIAAAVQTAQSAWDESRFPPPLRRADTRQVGHLAFTVGLGAVVPEPNTRRRTTQGARGVATAVTAELTYRLRAAALVADLDAAVDAGHNLVKAVLTTAETDVSIEWLSTDPPAIDADGTLAIITARFRAVHTYALA